MTYRYNVIIDVEMNTAAAKGSAGQVRGAFTALETDARVASGKIQGHLGAINQATAKSASGFSMWGQAFKGAFIGAVAGITFSTIISGITGIISKTFEAAQAAVDMAGKYQLTTNAMILFTGSVTGAKIELDDLHELAKNTAGLRMVDAEQGATRLRALGFEANIVKDLVSGLAKQKLISGVDDEGAINRVIVNLQQLRAGSPQIQKDIQQMVLALPSLSIEIVKTFGSLQKFKAALKQDAQGALDKFAKGLADAQAPAAGYADSLGKLEDAVTRAGRAFGEPILDPLIRGFKDLTVSLDANQDVWASWGSEVSNIIQGVADVARGLALVSHTLGLDIPDKDAGTARSLLRAGGRGIFSSGLGYAAVGPLANVISGVGVLGAAGNKREVDLVQQREDYRRNIRELHIQKDLRRDLGPAGANVVVAYSDESGSNVAGIATKKASDDEKIRLNRLEVIKAYSDQEIQVNQNKYAVLQAKLGIYHRFTIQDEIGYEKKHTALTIEGIQKDFQLKTKYFQEQIGLAEGNTKEIEKIQLEHAVYKDQSETKIYEAQAASAEKQIALEIQLADKKRQIAIQTNDLTLKAIAQQLSSREFNIEQEIKFTGEGYNKLIQISQAGLESETRAIRENLKLQLQDRSLMTGERLNLERDADLQIEAAKEQHRQKVVGITEREMQARLQQIENYTNRTVGLLNQQISGSGSLGSALRGDVFFGAALKTPTMESSLSGSGLTHADVLSVEQGKLSIYEAQSRVLDSIQAAQQKISSAEIEGAQAKLSYLQKTGGDADSIPAAKAALDILRLKAQQLLIDQESERLQQKLSGELSTINQWTKDIGEGKRDNILKDIQTVEVAKQYQAVTLESRTQQLFLGNAALIQQTREISIKKEMIAMQNDEFQAVLRLDRAKLQLGQKLVYSKTQADASVAEFLASQKGITDIVSDTKINLLTTAYSGLDAIAGRLTRSFGFFRDVIKDLLANLLKLALNSFIGKFIGGPQGGQAGGIFGGGQQSGGGAFSLANLFGGGGGASIGPGGTAGFNPGAGFGFGGGGARGGLSPVSYTGSVVDFNNNVVGTNTSGGGNLLGQAAGIGSSASALFTAAAPAALVGLFLSSLTETSLLRGALKGGLVGFVAAIINRSRRRREEEKIRNQATLDAFAALDKLIADVDRDRIDGTSALAQADGIRKSYLDTVSQLKDKKTRDIAVREVSRIDSKIETLKTAVANQITRRERLELMVPTFATGGSVSMGLQHGPGSPTSDSMMGYFPSAGTMARFSRSEYILDAETTHNIGPQNLDMLRATKGSSFAAMRNHMPVNGYAMGGFVTPSVSSNNSNPMQLHVTLQVGLSQQEFVQVVEATIRDTNGSTEQLAAIVSTLKTDGAEGFVYELSKRVAAKLANK